ncbi:MAG: sigma-54-dependent Fis family transcriptional regulator [Halioglobus sp.]|nr:sigma-54-dependent Fis family transcriptional regulator [Halioglobus sp.]
MHGRNPPTLTRLDADLTLPSVIPVLPGSAEEQRLVLTIVFHPDTSRIGAAAQVPCLDDGEPWILGRRSPGFVRAPGTPAAPLEDAHVSRQALALVSEGGDLAVERLPSSTSRCRIGGRELHEKVVLSREQLHAGVPILLGHSVVLLLRLAPWSEPVAPRAATVELCGGSAYMTRLREQVLRLADAGLDVLVRGETGTGKEVVATAIHKASARGSKPLVRVNMAAMPADLAPALLFGNSRGAYTGASSANEGFFGQADGGALFMDEIGDTPAEIQPQLLRALQEREIQAVGGAIRKVDVRVISATDAALEGEGCDFKAALRYRLGASEIKLLPLREHPEDIGELLLHFLEKNLRQLGRGHLLPGVETSALETAAWAELFYRFLAYDWPGNVRELANFSSQVAIASVDGVMLPDDIRQTLQSPSHAASSAVSATRAAPRRHIRDVSEAEFATALHDTAYEVANVARQLGVSRQSVYRRMDESPLYRLAGQVPLAELKEALGRHGGDVRAAARDLKVSFTGLRSRLRDTALDWTRAQED